MSIVPLLGLPAMNQAPSEVVELMRSRAEEADFSGEPSKTLKHYFERQLSGEVLGASLAPDSFALEDGVFRNVQKDGDVDRSGRVRVLGQALRFGGASWHEGPEQGGSEVA